ncbi:hypothetical protein Poli38472_008017 [Pythium oligandrum]|uniref:Uncharacterized protein n=1 Tax=Pythium oligandrum TaxID=41045 RepID=A0A8K1CMK6_PYTOL|nr:hypothetical protein Poli38472_008017 [Pythium oligandrum]|eukprot:TMW65375.1 hypothetical protein Poli38472_008017 [Pythium oligandrum]
MYVDVSPRGFRCTWFGLLALHGICITYYIILARLYVRLPSLMLAPYLEFFELDSMQHYYPLFAAMHALLAALHCLFAMSAVAASIRSRRLCFPTLKEFVRDRRLVHPDKKQGGRHTASALWSGRYDRVFGRQGFFGIEGKHFDTLFLIREIIETTLQTQQAHRLSQVAPRQSLNRCYVALLFINGWATFAIHVLAKRSTMGRRILVLACDAALDLMSSVVVPVTLMASYWRDYDPTVGGFGSDKWLNDEWFVNVSSEVQLILVTSWGDFASRFLFAIGLLQCVGNIKRILRVNSPQQTRQIVVNPSDPTPRAPTDKLLSSTLSITAISSQFRRTHWSIAIYTAFALASTVVLGLHLHAETLASPVECYMQTRPWGGTKPTCALILLDCHRSDIQGAEEEVAQRVSTLDPTQVVRLVIRHCPQLSVPSALQSLSSLGTIKMYNSSIVAWDEPAALTNPTHPKLRFLFMIRMRFPNGELPTGLTSSDFPKRLKDIKLCKTNLKTLPSDLDTKWNQGDGGYLFEISEFTAFPSVLLRMRPRELSFAMNQITQFPFEAASLSTLKIFNLGGNPITSLVLDSTRTLKVGPLIRFYMVGTNVSTLPSWLDGRLHAWIAHTFPLAPLHLYKTPFCNAVKKLVNGSTARLKDTQSTDYSFVMSAGSPDAASWNLQQLCIPQPVVFYPLAWEDAWHGLTQS